jgi:HprK-related kinase A
MTIKTFVSIPPYEFCINTELNSVKNHIDCIYANHQKSNINTTKFIDFNVSVKKSSGIRRLIKPQARFFSDTQEPFIPLPFNQAHAFLEWGMNWCVASTEANWLVVHAAILAKDNKAIMFPAPPGSGKSTLTAYLAMNGWRLLSDEMTIIELNSCTAIPFVRAISLKNNSINLVKKWFPHAIFSATAKDTQKGDVAHMMPPKSSVERGSEKATIIGIVFPKYTPDINLDIYQLDKTDTFMQLANNSFNYNVIGEDAFTTIAKLVEESAGFEIKYNNLSEVKSFLEEEILKL